MELNAITLGLTTSKARQKRDYVDEVERLLERSLSRESLGEGLSDEEVLEKTFSVVEAKLSEYDGLSERADNLLANLHNMSDKQAMDTLLSIDDTAIERKPFLVEGTSSKGYKDEIVLATEDWGERIRYAVMALIVGAILKLISMTIESGRGFNPKGGGRNRAPTERQRKINEELTSLANNAAKEWVEQKYSVFSDIIREEMIRLYNYASPGNLREPGSNTAGCAAEVAAEMVEYVNQIDLEPKRREELLRGGFGIIFTFIDNNVPLGHFAWNDKMRKRVARDFIDFVQRGYRAPLSKMVATLANVVDVEEGSPQRRLWLNSDDFKQDRVRFIDESCVDDLWYNISNLENMAQRLDNYLGNRHSVREFGKDYARLGQTYLWNKIDLNRDDAQSIIDLVIGQLGEDSDFQVVKATNPLTKATKYTVPQALSLRESNGTMGFDKPDIRIESVGREAYFTIRNTLSELGGEDAPVTFAKMFLSQHGEYNPKDNIQTRLARIHASYAGCYKQIDSGLKNLETQYEDYYKVIKELSRDRQKNKGKDFYVYDIPIKGIEVGALQKDGKFKNVAFNIPVGKHIEGVLRTVKDSFSSWKTLNAVMRDYTNIYDELSK